MKDREEKHRSQNKSEGGSEEEDEGEEEVVGWVLHEKLSQELSVKLYMGQSLVQPQGRSSTVGHQSLQVELEVDQTAGGPPYLVVAVVGVAHDGQDVPHGEDDGGQPGCPQSNIYLVGEKMMF